MVMVKSKAGGIKRKNQPKGMVNGPTTHYHKRGLTKHDPDYKAANIPQVNTATETKSVVENLEGKMGVNNSMVNRVITGPSELGASVGRIFSGQQDVSSISQDILLTSGVNVGLSGYAINMVTGRSPLDSFGYSISLSGQAAYGLLMRA